MNSILGYSLEFVNLSAPSPVYLFWLTLAIKLILAKFDQIIFIVFNTRHARKNY